MTFHPTPGEPNIPQEFKTCPAGKVINETTGNCVNATTLSSLLKDCGEGKYRNPETGRCKSYNNSDDDSKECKEGYERNPETGRCRKIKDNSGADYPVIPITGVEERSSFIAIWAIAGVAVVGIGYVLYQFRKEIWYLCRRITGKVKKQIIYLPLRLLQARRRQSQICQIWHHQTSCRLLLADTSLRQLA